MTATAGFWRLRRCLQISVAIAGALAPASVAPAQTPPPSGQVLVPGSSLARPGDIGVRPHTEPLIFVPNGGATQTPPAAKAAKPPAPRHRKAAAKSINTQ